MRLLLAPLALSLALGACATMKPGTAPTAFDGTYQGTVTMTHNNPGAPCGTTGTQETKLTVQNGTVMWKNLMAPVAADGSFYVQDGGTFFSGKISNRSMVARVNASGCHQIYDVTRPA